LRVGCRGGRSCGRGLRRLGGGDGRGRRSRAERRPAEPAELRRVVGGAATPRADPRSLGGGSDRDGDHRDRPDSGDRGGRRRRDGVDHRGGRGGDASRLDREDRGGRDRGRRRWRTRRRSARGLYPRWARGVELGRACWHARPRGAEHVAARHAVPDPRLVLGGAAAASGPPRPVDDRRRRDHAPHADGRRRGGHAGPEALSALLTEYEVARIVSAAGRADHEGMGTQREVPRQARRFEIDARLAAGRRFSTGRAPRAARSGPAAA